MPRRRITARSRRVERSGLRGAPGNTAASDGADAGAPHTADAPASDQRAPSRSARKRQAAALQELGVRLTRLTPAQLAALELPDELLEALLEYQRLRTRAALARQRQYIGRLMRAVDAGPIQGALDAKLSR